ncbi:MAG: hypothetical protein CMF72_09040 [Mameliella sp.]|nr:hypothetical protein [Mameliella sp.]|tara:strand:- start:5075 stop:5401 length:327 start_codon:yes stop_codon:yes gene_type:complete
MASKPTLKVHCTPEEKCEITAKAEKAHLSISAYLKTRGLSRTLREPSRIQLACAVERAEASLASLFERLEPQGRDMNSASAAILISELLAIRSALEAALTHRDEGAGT